MIEQYLADKSEFKKQTILLVILIIISVLGWLFLNSYRLSITDQKVKAYVLSQQQATWLNKFDYEENQEILKNTLDLVPLKEVENVQRAQVEIFRRHNLNLVNIQNGELKLKPKQAKKGTAKEKQLDYVQSSATVTGSWDDLIACLNSFEKQNFVIITDCKISTEKQSGLISAVMRYRVYYE